MTPAEEMTPEERLIKVEKKVDFIIAGVFGGIESQYAPLYKAIVGEDMLNIIYKVKDDADTR